MDLNILKKDVSFPYLTIHWLDQMIIIGQLSSQLRSKDPNVHLHVTQCISFIFNICYHFDIDMNQAWSRWEKKALKKHYIDTLYPQ